MHKKNGLKSYGGIKEKYSKELFDLSFGMATLMRIGKDVLTGLLEPGCDIGDAFSSWLNGPYQQMLQLERDVSDFESKVKNDPQFSDKYKQMFIAELIEPMRGGCRKIRDFDDKIMGRTNPQI